MCQNDEQFSKILIQYVKFQKMSAVEKQGGNRVAKTPKPRWQFDFSSRSNQNVELPPPPGFSSTGSALVHADASREADPNLRIKRCWDLALGPFKQVPMNLFIMYMSGSSISIFPIMMVVMMMFRPLKTLFSVKQAFKGFETGANGLGVNILGQKLVFILGNLANVALAMYKCHTMGLLPTHASDWLAFADPLQRAEVVVGGMGMG